MIKEGSGIYTKKLIKRGMKEWLEKSKASCSKRVAREVLRESKGCGQLRRIGHII